MRKGERGTRNGERGNEKRDNSPNSDRTLDEIIKQLVKKCKTLLNNAQGYGKVRWICTTGKISS